MGMRRMFDAGITAVVPLKGTLVRTQHGLIAAGRTPGAVYETVASRATTTGTPGRSILLHARAPRISFCAPLCTCGGWGYGSDDRVHKDVGGIGQRRAGDPQLVHREPARGSIQEIAKRCTDESNGRYTGRRQTPAVRRQRPARAIGPRLAAKDSTVDIVGMDVIWTAEFANAGWIEEWPSRLSRR